VDKSSTDLSSAVGKFFGSLKIYQHNEVLEDLAIPGMIVKEFWQHGDKDHTKFEYGKPFVTKQVNVNLPFTRNKFHKWYYLECVYGLNFIEARVPEEIF
jgi:hypothetical protein